MSSVGQAAFGVVGLVGGFMLGSPMLGLSIGLMVGGMLFPATSEDDQAKPTPGTLQVQTSTYGLTIPVVYGTRKIAGNIIWYGDFTPIEMESEQQGGKGGGGGGQTSTWYVYTCSVAIGLCMGPATVLKIWSGDQLIWDINTPATNTLAANFYDGTQTTPDPFVAMFTTRQPVWKGLCYVVLPDFFLGQQTALPNFTFEVGQSTGPIIPNGEFLFGVVGGEFSQFQFPGTTGNRKHGTMIYYDARRNMTVKAGVDHYQDNEILIGPITTPPWCGYVSWEDAIYSVVIEANTYALQKYDYNTGELLLTDNYTRATYRQIKKMGIGPRGIYTHEGKNGGGYLVRYDKDTLEYRTERDIWTNLRFTSLYSICADYDYVYVLATLWIGQPTQWGGPNDCYVFDAFTLNLVKVFNIGGAGGSTWPNWSICEYGPYLYIMGYDSDHDGYVGDSMACLNKTDGSVVWLHSFTPSYGQNDNIGGSYAFPNRLVCTPSRSYSGKQIEVYNINNLVTSTDTTPPDISEDILTNTFYGSGISINKLDSGIFSNTKQYCIDNDLLVSMVFDKQISVLDALQEIIQHHNGYIKYSNGTIAHAQLQQENVVATLDSTNIVQATDRDTFPISMTKKGGRDYFNKIIANYTNRANTYSVGTVLADDMVDINTYGTLENTANLNGFCVYDRAYKMAYLLLEKSLLSPEGIKFKLGPNNLTLGPGDVIDITDVGLELSNYKVRILSLSETDGYAIEIEGIKEYDSLYGLMNLTATINIPVPKPNLYDAPVSVLHEIAVELPPIYVGENVQVGLSYGKPSQTSWSGAALYQSNSSSGPFTLKDTEPLSGIAGVVDAVGISATTSYIDVTLDTDDVLESSITFDSFMQSSTENLMVVNTSSDYRFIRFQNVQLLAANKWRLSGLLFDTIGFPLFNTYWDIDAGDNFALYKKIPFINKLTTADTHKNIYYKIASFNFGGTQQELSDCSLITEPLINKAQKPLPPYNVLINNLIGLDGNKTVKVESGGDIEITWASRNRFNDGGYDYARSDAIHDDYDFSRFILEVYQGATLKRTEIQILKTFTYTAAMQATDGVSGTVTFKLYQQDLAETSDAEQFTITLV